MHKILMIEDDTATRDALERHLSRWGYQVRAAKNFQNILEQLEAFHPHLVLLDISLPFFDGYYWCRQIRRASQVPILFLSSAGDDMNLVMAINLGADDYISKPFSLREVAARVKAVLRRTRQGETEHAPEQIVYKTLVLDIIKKKVCIDGEEAPLTKKEFEILLLLLQNKGRVFSREDILNRIWSDEVYVLDRTIDVNITRLRKKIGVYGKCIVTRLGYGYCFEAE